jgi:hypothetical protein
MNAYGTTQYEAERLARAMSSFLRPNATDAPTGRQPSLVTCYEALLGSDALYGVHKVWRRCRTRESVMRSGRLELNTLRRMIDLGSDHAQLTIEEQP